jgi:3-mercaptopyruvate sulfurtransferase SseA
LFDVAIGVWVVEALSGRPVRRQGRCARCDRPARHCDRQRSGRRPLQGHWPQPLWRPGCVPGSVQVSAATLVDPAGQGFTTLADAQAKFAAKGVTPDKHVIAYCGGGISATIDLFLLHQLGYDDITLYDASMGEWARDESVPIETG